jgi:tetratricopeptide (TPR) repeat protein
VLVGREVVLGVCDAALDAALAGRGRLLLVTGEAGIGKSTVVQAVAGRAAAAGAMVRWGACWEGEAFLPFGVWVDCLRRPGGDACAAAVNRLERGEFGIGTDADDAERAYARFVREVADALHGVAAAQAQVLVLEDVHWADTRSLQLLRALAGHLPTMPLLVAATYREDELPADRPLAAIGGGADRLALEGLDENDVATLLGAVLDRPPSTEEARAVHRQTGGNPLFVTEVARLVAAGSSTVLPTGVLEVLARRLARVSASCNDVLGACSAVGTEFDACLVGEVLGVPDAAVTAALEEAATARLVAPLPTRPGDWEFVHALVRTARYEALGIAERAALHRRVVDVLEGRSVPAGILAHHAARARFESGDPRPAQFAAAAARDALDRFAWDQAVVLWRRALDAAPPGSDGDALRAEAWLGLGDARLRSGDAAAAEAFAAAAAIGRAGGRPELIGRAALGFGAGFGSFEVRLLDRRQLELLEEAVTALPGDSELRPLVLARLSVALSFVGSEERRLQLADEATGLSRRAGDRRALAAALAARCDVLAGPDHTAERLGAATEIVSLAQRNDDLPLELLGRRLRAVALLELRDLIAFDAEVAAYARAAERLSDPLYAWWAPQWRAMRAYADGKTEQAADLADQARAIGAAGSSSNAEILRAIVGVFVAVDRRDAVELDAQWSHLLGQHPELFEQAAAAAMVPFVDARFGRRDRVRAQLAGFGKDWLERLPRDQEWLAALAQLVVAGVAAGERAFVAYCYELLHPYAGLGVFEGAAAVDHGVADRFLALAAGYLGDREAARRHIDAALVEAAKSGRLVLAHTRADGAWGLLSTGDEDDRRTGRELARQAATDYQALGFTALAAELSALVGGDGAAEPAAAPGAALVREGDTWAFAFDGTTVRVRHAKGIADLAVLLAHPGREVHVAMLEGAAGPRWQSAPQPRLDSTAVGQYRERLRDLEEELDEADRHGDVVRAVRLAAERDALVQELTHAFGLGGRARDVASDANERLRKAVSARVKATIDRLEELDPALGRHLRNSVRTGFWCSYQPERRVSWAVTANRPG